MRSKEAREIYPGYRPSVSIEVFSANLKAFMEKRGLTQRQVAMNAGCDPSYISRILQGQPCSWKAISRIADAVGEDVGDLLTSRQVDSWIAEHLSIFQKRGLRRAVLGLNLGEKSQLARLTKVIKEKKTATSEGTEFHFLEEMSMQQKWALRALMERLEGIRAENQVS